MRIALVAESFFPAVDGTTTTVKAVVDRLVDTGHEVTVLAPAPGLSSHRGCRVVRVHGRESASHQVREALTAARPEVVHVTSPGRVGRAALTQARVLGLPTLVVQQTPLSAIDAERWSHRLGDLADRVLVSAQWMRGRLGVLGIAADLWVPGVDTRAFGPQLHDTWLHDTWARSRSRNGPQVVVGYVGSLHRRHGVRALADLALVPGIRPVVIGDGPQREWLAKRLPDARFTGAMETGDLTRAIASLDVLVHPGLRETCCHALREAAASGVPVVAPRAGGAVDAVRPLETGLLYDATDQHALARAVAAVAADRHRGLLGARGRELALRRPWTSAVDELVERHYRPLAGVPQNRPEAA